MELAQLEAFMAVAEQGSFSAAANTLFITQPAVSKRIQQLEEQLGHKLFDRLGKLITLTPAGQALLPPAQRVLSEVANCRTELEALNQKISGPLTFGTSHHIGLRRLPKILRHFINTYPEVQIDLRLYESEEALAHIIDNTLELAVITLPADPNPNLLCEKLWSDPLVFCVAPEHPFTSRTSVSAAELCEHPALLPARHSATRRLLDQQLNRQSQQLGQVLETNYLETNKGLAEANLGWTLLPATMLDTTLHPLIVEGLDINRELGIIQRKGRTLTPAATMMLQLLKKNAG